VPAEALGDFVDGFGFSLLELSTTSAKGGCWLVLLNTHRRHDLLLDGLMLKDLDVLASVPDSVTSSEQSTVSLFLGDFCVLDSLTSLEDGGVYILVATHAEETTSSASTAGVATGTRFTRGGRVRPVAVEEAPRTVVGGGRRRRRDRATSRLGLEERHCCL
jgi:hypothetical protein